MTCATCDDYRLVPDGDGGMVECPDCRAVICPAHRLPARVRATGEILQPCSGCVAEAARAVRRFAQDAAA